jgi:hypothetical protein
MVEVTIQGRLQRRILLVFISEPFGIPRDLPISLSERDILALY